MRNANAHSVAPLTLYPTMPRALNYVEFFNEGEEIELFRSAGFGEIRQRGDRVQGPDKAVCAPL